MERLLKRSEVKPEYTWDIESIYNSVEEWEKDFARAQQLLPKMGEFQGKLGQSAKELLAALKARDEGSLLLENVIVYAFHRKDEDNTNSTFQALFSRAMSLNAQAAAALAYMTPEILAIPSATLQSFMQEESGLQLYKHELENLMRQKEHVRSAEVEALLAQTSEVGHGAQSIFGMLDNADMKFPSIEDEEGNEVEVTKGRFIRFLESHKREVRAAAFKAVYSTYGKFRNTLGATYAAAVKKDIFFARARGYKSSRESALYANNIPESVYDNLVATVNKNLPTLHRYIQLRKKLLGLEELHMYDLYAHMVAEVDKKIPFEEAIETIMKALAPLGEEYLSIAREGLTTQRWVDRYENVGKTSGAYSGGGYATHPFIMLNYQDTLDSMFTTAHELGHSMHSYFTRKKQPYAYGDYAIFVAEVASTFNEALLTNYLLKNTQDKKLRMYLINHYLEQFRTTLYRQTMFAEFEHAAHMKAEAGEALTPDMLQAMYYDLNKKYYGTDGMVVDEEIGLEWSRIPHFYRAYYVFQYSTGLSAAVSLSQQVLSEGEPAVGRYLGFLRSGSSDYPINVLKKAGVDMTSSEPVQQALDVFAAMLDEMEKLAQ